VPVKISRRLSATEMWFKRWLTTFVIMQARKAVGNS